jgi:hypothetical protein
MGDRDGHRFSGSLRRADRFPNPVGLRCPLLRRAAGTEGHLPTVEAGSGSNVTMRENRRSLRRGDVPAARRVFHRERELGTICSRGGPRRAAGTIQFVSGVTIRRSRRSWPPPPAPSSTSSTKPRVGRAYVYGLLAAGEAGVRHMLGLFRQQIDEALASLGVRVIDELDPSYLELPPSWASPRVSSA